MVEVIASKQLDHHGIVAGVIADLGLQELIDSRLTQGSSTKISHGQAIAAMLINCLGFTSRPLTLTPQFFESKAVDVLFGEAIEASDFNRHRLGRCLDAISTYGCDELFSELAQHVCRQEGISQQFISLDTSSFSVTGDYDSASDAHTIALTHGYSKAHRPDLKQMVLELLVSQDGGVPLASKSFSGNASDNAIFKARCEALIEQLKASEGPSYLAADSKLYSKSNADNLSALPFITRIPRRLKEEQAVVHEALASADWAIFDEANQWACHHCTHYGITQRWLVVYSNAAHARAKKTLEKHIKKEREAINSALKQLRNQAFRCEPDARKAFTQLEKRLTFHCLVDKHIQPKAHYQSKGRPKSGELPTHYSYSATAKLAEDNAKQKQFTDEKSCYVIGTNIAPEQLSAEQVIQAYKRQNASIERGFRFLKDPYFFAQSFFIKKPSRLMALLMLMTLALVVYSIAQRRLRQALQENKATLSNQINQPTEKPTLRWVFQMLEGISIVYLKTENQIKKTMTGLDQLKAKIINLFSEKIVAFYLFGKNTKSCEEMCSM